MLIWLKCLSDAAFFYPAKAKSKWDRVPPEQGWSQTENGFFIQSSLLQMTRKSCKHIFDVAQSQERQRS